MVELKTKNQSSKLRSQKLTIRQAVQAISSLVVAILKLKLKLLPLEIQQQPKSTTQEAWVTFLDPVVLARVNQTDLETIESWSMVQQLTVQVVPAVLVKSTTHHQRMPTQERVDQLPTVSVVLPTLDNRMLHLQETLSLAEEDQHPIASVVQATLDKPTLHLRNHWLRITTDSPAQASLTCSEAEQFQIVEIHKGSLGHALQDNTYHKGGAFEL